MIPAITARLDVPAYLFEAPPNPPTAYVVLYPDPGLVTPTRYAAANGDYTGTLMVMAVSTSPSGVIRLVEHVRSRLTGWTPPGDSSQSPLVEQSPGPILTDRVESETRYSLTLTYSHHHHRKATP